MGSFQLRSCLGQMAVIRTVTTASAVAYPCHLRTEQVISERLLQSIAIVWEHQGTSHHVSGIFSRLSPINQAYLSTKHQELWKYKQPPRFHFAHSWKLSSPLCHEARAHFEHLNTTQRWCGAQGSGVLVQEFLDGTEPQLSAASCSLKP